MSKEKYVYKSPLENGYKQFKLTTKQHNNLFPNRQKKWYNKFEYYYNDKGIILHKFSNKLTIFLNTLFFPISLLINGLINFKQMKNELKESYNQKKYGVFASDNISYKSEKESYVHSANILIKEEIKNGSGDKHLFALSGVGGLNIFSYNIESLSSNLKIVDNVAQTMH